MGTKRTVKWLWLALIIATGAAIFSVYGPSVFATKDYAKISPTGRYRLEYLRPGYPYLFSLAKDMPRIVRLYDNRTGKKLGESNIVDLSGNGKVYWASMDDPNIRVGMNIVFPASPEAE